jgi:hypothetical protein
VKKEHWNNRSYNEHRLNENVDHVKEPLIAYHLTVKLLKDGKKYLKNKGKNKCSKILDELISFFFKFLGGAL